MPELIIAGIGGQGINRLARVIAECCRDADLHCQYTVHKGGAQTLGSVYAEMRVSSNPATVLGPGIPDGALDGLVAMDPWEALRHIHLARHDSQVFVEAREMPLFGDRKAEDPEAMRPRTAIERLKELPISINWKNYRQHALEKAGDARMANYFAGLDCLSILSLSERQRYHEIFYQEITGAVPLSLEPL